MTVTAFLALLGVWIAAICSPGPDLLCLTRIATRSRVRGLAAAAGSGAGIVVGLARALAGLGALLAAAPWLLALLQIAGGAYLLWLGFSALRAGVRQLRSRAPLSLDDAHLPSQPPPTESRPRDARATASTPSAVGVTDSLAAAADRGRAGAFAQGLLTNLSNPKAVVFFGAVFTRFITPGMGFVSQLRIVAVLAASAMVWFGAVAWGRGLPRFADKLHRAGPWIDAISGVFFLVLAVALLAEGATSL